MRNADFRADGAMMMCGQMRMTCVMGMRCITSCWRN
jgi:hypothetical protein